MMTGPSPEGETLSTVENEQPLVAKRIAF